VLFRRHRGAHAAYEKDLAEAQRVTDSQSASHGGSHKKTDEQHEKSRKRQGLVGCQAKDAEALIMEANDRLQKALTSKSMTEIMAAQHCSSKVQKHSVKLDWNGRRLKRTHQQQRKQKLTKKLQLSDSFCSCYM